MDKARDGMRLTPEEGMRLLESGALASLAKAADAVTRRLHPEPFRTYNIDRNINYTNICLSGCKFCAFYRRPGDREGYVIESEELNRKIQETIELGGNQILLQGGMNPDLKIGWYENLLRGIKKRFPQINVHGFSPPEIEHIARVSGLEHRGGFTAFERGGLGQSARRRRGNPGRSRSPRSQPVQMLSRGLAGSLPHWHKLGGRGSATMMFGHVETLAQRIEHLERLRRLQDETGGFTAFICWTFQPSHTALAELPKIGAFEYLKTLAVSRLYLDNFANLQASWVTQGLAVGQLALRCGANDFGSLMIEENVVAAAGGVLL